MTSRSSYIYTNSPGGLGQLMVPSSTVEVYEQQQVIRPTLHSTGNSVAPATLIARPPKAIQPIVTTSLPTTGGSYPILTSGSGGNTQPSNGTKSGTSLLTMDGDHLVLAGNHRIKKTQALMIGAGVAGAAILLKTIL